MLRNPSAKLRGALVEEVKKIRSGHLPRLNRNAIEARFINLLKKRRANNLNRLKKHSISVLITPPME
jgi:hypothetical protein